MAGSNFVSGNAAGGARTPFPGLNDPDASFLTNHPTTPDLYIGGNDIHGLGENAVDSRFLNVSGTLGHPCIVELNHIHHCHRFGHLIGSYVTFQKNRFGMSYHHGFTGTDLDDYYTTDVSFL